MDGIRDPGSGIRGFRASTFVVRDAGDSALLLELDPVIDAAVNSCAIGIADSIKRQALAGVRDVVPTYRSVAVHFDPLRADLDAVRDALLGAVDAPLVPVQGTLVEVPVVYGGENGADLGEVAAFANVPPETVIERHYAREYRVFMLGFLPGFAYMGTVDESIAAPRKATPRTRIPAGSVAIAARQTGIYPRECPGGWQVIGRTPLRLFDPNRQPASLFAPGDRVRFVPVEGIEDQGSGIGEQGSAVKNGTATDPRSLIPYPYRFITVLKPGLLTTIQDSGRWGHQDRGVPVAGVMDPRAYRLANALVGNPPGAAVLEATLLGPELRFEQPVTVAITGADLGASIDGASAAVDVAHRVKSGGVLRFGERRSGTRACIAIDGGVDVPLVLGSRSTHVVSGLGGIEGRALRASDRVQLGNSDDLSRRNSNTPRRQPLRSAPLLPPHGGARLRMMPGPHDYYFDTAALEWLERTRFIITPQSNRMGYRLVPDDRDAPRIPDPGSRSAGSMISDATFIGGLQIPPSGDPILLMADRQTSGGYPQVATLITADVPLAGQLAPGDWIEFTLCTRWEAIAALREQDEGFSAS